MIVLDVPAEVVQQVPALIESRYAAGVEARDLVVERAARPGEGRHELGERAARRPADTAPDPAAVDQALLGDLADEQRRQDDEGGERVGTGDHPGQSPVLVWLWWRSAIVLATRSTFS